MDSRSDKTMFKEKEWKYTGNENKTKHKQINMKKINTKRS